MNKSTAWIFIALVLLVMLAAIVWRDDSAPESLPGSIPYLGYTDTSGIINPADYDSPSTEFRLSVNPTHRQGQGGAHYRLSKSGAEIWSADLPYTLINVVVTDQGETIGYSYSHGVEGFGADEGCGDYRVVILDATGQPRLNEATIREQSRFIHGTPDPHARALVVDAPNDRVVFRIADADVNRGDEQWWIYRLSDGESLGKLVPKQRMGDNEYTSSIVDAKPVAGTPLMLLHWWRYQYPDPMRPRKSMVGARFTLVDRDLIPVWSLELPRDYQVAGDEDAEDRLIDWMQRRGAVLRTGESTFDLYIASKGQQVAFQITKQADTWSVAETARSPFNLADLVPPTPEQASMPTTPMELVRKIELQPDREESAIRGFYDFVMDDQGRIAFLRSEESDREVFVLIDQQGNLLKEIPLGQWNANDSKSAGCWISGDRFLVTRSQYGVEAKTSGFWIDVEKETVTPISGFACPSVDRLRCFSDGSFVALATTRYKYTMTTGLYGFDRNGKQTWSRDEQTGDGPEDLFSPEDIAVTSDDQIAVIDNIRNTIQLYDRQGRFLRVIDIEQTWGREPSYLSGIDAMRSGFHIHDFDGAPPNMIAGKDGAADDGFTPRMSNGRLFDAQYFSVAPDDTIWATDGSSIVRLDSKGVVDRVLGVPPDTTHLRSITASAVDARDRIYIVDANTAITHVFDSRGEPHHLCIPDPADFRGDLFDPSISVSDEGDVFVCVSGMNTDGTFLRFSDSGARIDSLVIEGSDQWHMQPGTDKSLVLTYSEARLLDGSRNVLRTISRRPDGNWIERPTHVCFDGDGSFAILASHESVAGSVNVYRPNGDPVATIELPPIVGSFPRFAFNGDRIVVSGEGHLLITDDHGTLVQLSKLDFDDTHVQPHIVAGGSELLIVPSRGTTLRWYRLP